MQRRIKKVFGLVKKKISVAGDKKRYIQTTGGATISLIAVVGGDARTAASEIG